MTERKPLFDNEEAIIACCETINNGAPRGEVFDSLDEIEEVFFELYEKIQSDKLAFKLKVEKELQDSIRAEIDKWTDFSMEDCPIYEMFIDWAEESLDDKVRDETPHGECGTDKEEGFFRWNNKNWLVTYRPDWNRYDKQYYYIDNCGNNTTAVEIS